MGDGEAEKGVGGKNKKGGEEPGREEGFLEEPEPKGDEGQKDETRLFGEKREKEKEAGEKEGTEGAGGFNGEEGFEGKKAEKGVEDFLKSRKVKDGFAVGGVDGKKEGDEKG